MHVLSVAELYAAAGGRNGDYNNEASPRPVPAAVSAGAIQLPNSDSVGCPALLSAEIHSVPAGERHFGKCQHEVRLAADRRVNVLAGKGLETVCCSVLGEDEEVQRGAEQKTAGDHARGNRRSRATEAA